MNRTRSLACYCTCLLLVLGVSGQACAGVTLWANDRREYLAENEREASVSRSVFESADLGDLGIYLTPRVASAYVRDDLSGRTLDQANLPVMNAPIAIQLAASVGSGGIFAGSSASATVRLPFTVRSRNGFSVHGNPSTPDYFATFVFGVDGQIDMAIEEDEIRNLLDMPQDYENRNVNGWGVLYFDNLHPFYGGYGHIRGEIGDTRGGRVFVGDQGYVGLNMSIPLLGRDREPELDTYAMIYPEIPTNYLANAYIEGDEQSNRWRYDFGPGGPFNRNPVIEVLAPLRIDPDDPNTATGELHFEVAVEAVAYPWESVDVDFGNTLSLVDFGLNGSVGALTTPDSFFRNYAFEFPDTRGVPEPSFGFCFAAGLLAILRSRGVRRTGSLSRKKS